jgi:hypothetical protein
LGVDDVVSKYRVTFTWDDETSVWIATSDDVFGLVLEDRSFDNLLERTCFAVPELLEAENTFQGDISLDFAVSRLERLLTHG